MENSAQRTAKFQRFFESVVTDFTEQLLRYLFIICSIFIFLSTYANINSLLQKPNLKVLDIGNSYTIDATSYLKQIINASGSDIDDMCLYTAVRGSGSFKTWYNTYFDKDNSTYTIKKVLGGINANITTGTGEKNDGALFREALENEKWDVIIIHQVSTYAPYYYNWGTTGTGGYLNEFLALLKEKQPQAKIGFQLIHSYWDNYSGNKEGSSFERWKLIAESVKNLCSNYDVDFVIPYGTAVENLRSSSLNNEYDLTRDGTHCGHGLCRYTATCCYYEALIAPRSGISVLGNSARYDASNQSSKYPATNVTDENAHIAQMAAFLATNEKFRCLNPEEYILKDPSETCFNLVYKIDSEIYSTSQVNYLNRITTVEPAPSKEGYTFSGWSDIPPLMPAHDVTVTGTFSINKYKLVYKVDGVDYKSYDVEYGTAITPEEAPTKEGYTFSGWSEIPETMPANDVTVTGTFTQTEYRVGDDTYEITGEGTVTIKRSNQTGSVEISSTIDINGYTYQVTAIGENAFKDNTEIKSVTIENGIKAIGDKAFSGCVNLIAINIGKDVNTIGHKAFADIGTASFVRKRSNDASIITVNCYAESVPLSVTDAFENTPIGTGLLLVEDSSVDAYKATSPWSGFGTILGINEAAGIRSTRIETQNAIIYDMRGNRINQLERGVNIIRMDNGKARKVVVGSLR